MWLMTEKQRHRIKSQLLPNSSTNYKQEKGTETVPKKTPQGTVSWVGYHSSPRLGTSLAYSSDKHPRYREALQTVLTLPQSSRLSALGLQSVQVWSARRGGLLSVSRLRLAHTRKQAVHPTDLSHWLTGWVQIIPRAESPGMENNEEKYPELQAP